MQVNPVSSFAEPAAKPSTEAAATAAFGLSFDALLKIILTQLTYQDPLKPMDNFQFVSQLAQFSQIQIGQTTNDRLQTLVTAQANAQASGLLGQQVDIEAGAALVTGKVSAITFENGEPRLTITAAGGQTISNIVLSSITQIRKGTP
ncbi:flagellar hook capping FlgD N-terminal domain-containing protein [Sphingomonas sp. So64.6b]|uniref:flagellar hook assembly protein FlgD n=1 Tax=Sphingomonas sp. So64.6b TaxID=2997354 RepID=UPI001FCEAA95|nr:flagellar hook capping FlgD N-terminal domain-containing protein [Sphingomonas sp. So64.6b]